MSRPGSNSVDVDVSQVDAGARRHRRVLEATALRLLTKLKLKGVSLSVALVDDAAIKRLNREWRKKDKATDVLSFPLGHTPGPGPRVLGDVIISIDTTRRAAKEYGVPVREELARYLAHGLLHVLGFDHQTRAEARRMEAMERRLLGHAGMLTDSSEI